MGAKRNEGAHAALEPHPGGDRATSAERVQGRDAVTAAGVCRVLARSLLQQQGRLPWESELLPQLGRGSSAEGSGQTAPFLLKCDPTSSSSVLRKLSLGSNFPFECLWSPTRQSQLW